MKEGFLIEPGMYSQEESDAIFYAIQDKIYTKEGVENSAKIFAVRKLFEYVPELISLVVKPALARRIEERFGRGYFISKSIYFDKPAASNWFVSYHQDLSVSVTNRRETSGYEGWTVKDGQFGVQPPADILEDNITVRLHLDDTDGSNGALRVIPFSHERGIRRFDIREQKAEVLCEVPAGGVMWMRPLLFHASSRSLPDSRRRRVIHVEFSRQNLAPGIDWAEKITY